MQGIDPTEPYNFKTWPIIVVTTGLLIALIIIFVSLTTKVETGASIKPRTSKKPPPAQTPGPESRETEAARYALAFILKHLEDQIDSSKDLHTPEPGKADYLGEGMYLVTGEIPGADPASERFKIWIYTIDLKWTGRGDGWEVVNFHLE